MHMKKRVNRVARQAARGYNLIEMMVVVAIIAILVGTIAASYVHARAGATVSATQSNLKEIGTALELYNTDNQAYPASGNVTSTLIGSNYLNTTPNSPGQGGGAYVYTLAASGTEYTVTDPATYNSASLANLGKSSSVAAGVAAAPTAKCGQTGCTHVGYSNSADIFGY